jgi:hypothetical protein
VINGIEPAAPVHRFKVRGVKVMEFILSGHNKKKREKVETFSRFLRFKGKEKWSIQ